MPRAALMEAAGTAVARTARSMLGNSVVGRRIHVLCGTGNNGGDGLVAARHLHNAGARVHVFVIGKAERLCQEPEQFYRVLTSIGCKITHVETINERLLFMLDFADLIVDAMLGTGAKGPPRQPHATLIQAINKAGKRVLAVDIPTGVCADTGRVYDPLSAERTVTFGLPKLGLLLYPGAEHVGALTVEDIGFPREHLAWNAADAPQRVLLSATNISDLIPPRRPNTHKGSYGHVFVVAGSMGMLGAGALTARAAARGGAGLVTWGGPHTLWQTISAKVTEVMTLGLAECAPGSIGEHAVPTVEQVLKNKDVLALGPGIGRHDSTVAFVQELLRRVDLPTVIDADALFALASFEVVGDKPWVLTPHPGEAARLLGCSITDIEQDRPAAVREIAQKYGCVAVLKGVPTLVTDHKEGILYVNSTGNAGMATGGTGDVLTGLIAGLISQGLTPLAAAKAAVFLHGRAGDIACRTGQAGMIAGDLIEAIPRAFAEYWE